MITSYISWAWSIFNYYTRGGQPVRDQEPQFFSVLPQRATSYTWAHRNIAPIPSSFTTVFSSLKHFGHFLLRHLGHWSISVICLKVVLKLATKVFFQPIFWNILTEMTKFFSVISETFLSMTEKGFAHIPLFS